MSEDELVYLGAMSLLCLERMEALQDDQKGFQATIIDALSVAAGIRMQQRAMHTRIPNHPPMPNAVIVPDSGTKH